MLLLLNKGDWIPKKVVSKTHTHTWIVPFPYHILPHSTIHCQGGVFKLNFETLENQRKLITSFIWKKASRTIARGGVEFTLLYACHASSTRLVLHATLYSPCSILLYCIAGYTSQRGWGGRGLCTEQICHIPNQEMGVSEPGIHCSGMQLPWLL